MDPVAGSKLRPVLVCNSGLIVKLAPVAASAGSIVGAALCAMAVLKTAVTGLYVMDRMSAFVTVSLKAAVNRVGRVCIVARGADS